MLEGLLDLIAVILEPLLPLGLFPLPLLVRLPLPLPVLFRLLLLSAGAFFFWTGLLSACSQLAAAPLARRIGMINTMVFTHIPSSLFLIGAALATNLEVALACLLARSLLSQMDVPARGAFVMSVVTPAERPAAASFTALPRSLAAAISPSITGAMILP